MSTLLELDGSFGEGGGQILRTSLALSLITGQPFRLRNVRAGRAKPGLQPQHLMSVQAAAAVGGAQTRGASLRSGDLEFHPGKVTGGANRFDIGTAGATGLVLHTLYLPLALRGGGPCELTLVGGTHVQTSPCFHFLQTTWARWMRRLGLEIDLWMDRPGFYPRGGGQVRAAIRPCRAVHGFTGSQTGPVRLHGFSAVAGLPEGIAERQARRARTRLEELHGLDFDVEVQTWPGGPGTVLAVVVDTPPVPVLFFGLGERGKPAERVADEAVAQASAYLHAVADAAGAFGNPVDSHSADQIVLPLALSPEPSAFAVAAVTRHLLTNLEVIRRFLGRDMLCEGEEGGPGVVRIQ